MLTMLKNRSSCKVWGPYQIDRVRKAVLESVILQKLSKVRDVARGKSERVQFWQLGVRWYPGQAGFQFGESFAQHSHPRPLPGIGRISLRLPRFLLVRLGQFAPLLDPPVLTVIIQLLIRITVGIIASNFPRRPLQMICSPSVTCVMVLSIACCWASGHVLPVPWRQTGVALSGQQWLKI